MLSSETGGDERLAADGVCRSEKPAGQRLDPKGLGKAWADPRHRRVQGLAAERQAGAPVAVEGGRGQARNAMREIRIVIAGDARGIAMLAEEARLDGDQAIGIVVAERPQQHRIDHGEERSVESHTECERGDDCEDKGGGAAKIAKQSGHGVEWSPGGAAVIIRSAGPAWGQGGLRAAPGSAWRQ